MKNFTLRRNCLPWNWPTVLWQCKSIFPIYQTPFTDVDPFVWLCMIFCINVWHFVTICGGLEQCMIVCINVWPFLTVFDCLHHNVWPFVTMYGCLNHCMAFCNVWPFYQCLAVCINIWQFVSIYDLLYQCILMQNII